MYIYTLYKLTLYFLQHLIFIENNVFVIANKSFISFINYYFIVDRPLIVQFAARCGKELADATEIIVPYVLLFDILLFKCSNPVCIYIVLEQFE